MCVLVLGCMVNAEDLDAASVEVEDDIDSVSNITNFTYCPNKILYRILPSLFGINLNFHYICSKVHDRHISGSSMF